MNQCDELKTGNVLVKLISYFFILTIQTLFLKNNLGIPAQFLMCAFFHEKPHMLIAVLHTGQDFVAYVFCLFSKAEDLETLVSD